MKSAALVHLALFTLAGVASAVPHDSAANHMALHRRHSSIIQPRAATRRCKARNNSSSTNDKVTTSNSDNSQNSTPSGTKSSSSSGVISVNVPRCGKTGATKDVEKESGPNGSIDFLNCGIESGGWNPPKISVNDLKTVDLASAIKQSGSPFTACEKHLSTINKYANQNGIPPIIIASIAMQESSCNEKTIGGAGEQGLMQITKDKCINPPGGDCLDVDYNVKTGTAYLKGLIDQHDGNFLVALGAYNGWEPGMTVKDAETWFGGNCRTQRNLDYLHQNLNVWYQNVNAYGSVKYGKYFNLDKCANQD